MARRVKRLASAGGPNDSGGGALRGGLFFSGAHFVALDSQRFLALIFFRLCLGFVIPILVPVGHVLLGGTAQAGTRTGADGFDRNRASFGNRSTLDRARWEDYR